ncbi:hypothetical protein LTS10_011646 [Elasticomyces elasticus]|nr:hypothetical protein LTS10_011646 [Elasticomyces elasticus]
MAVESQSQRPRHHHVGPVSQSGSTSKPIAHKHATSDAQGMSRKRRKLADKAEEATYDDDKYMRHNVNMLDDETVRQLLFEGTKSTPSLATAVLAKSIERVTADLDNLEAIASARKKQKQRQESKDTDATNATNIWETYLYESIPSDVYENPESSSILVGRLEAQRAFDLGRNIPALSGAGHDETFDDLMSEVCSGSIDITPDQYSSSASSTDDEAENDNDNDSGDESDASSVSPEELNEQLMFRHAPKFPHLRQPGARNSKTASGKRHRLAAQATALAEDHHTLLFAVTRLSKYALCDLLIEGSTKSASLKRHVLKYYTQTVRKSLPPVIDFGSFLVDVAKFWEEDAEIKPSAATKELKATIRQIASNVDSQATYGTKANAIRAICSIGEQITNVDDMSQLGSEIRLRFRDSRVFYETLSSVFEMMDVADTVCYIKDLETSICVWYLQKSAAGMGWGLRDLERVAFTQPGDID